MKLEHGVCFKFTQTNKKDEPSYSTSHFKNSMVRIEIWIVPTPLVPTSTRCRAAWAYDAAVTLMGLQEVTNNVLKERMQKL
jgi:hypothetical protein